MTEEEARTKWCPFSRQAAVIRHDPASFAVSANRDGGDHYGVGNCNCLASGCMAWRQETDVTLLVHGHGSCGLVK